MIPKREPLDYLELIRFLTTGQGSEESLTQGKAKHEGVGKGAWVSPNSWNQEHKLLYDCPAATAVLCLLPHPPCADQLSPT